MRKRSKRLLYILTSLIWALTIIFNAPPITAVVSAATTEIATQIMTIEGFDHQNNPTSLQVLMPDWNRISFSTLPPLLSSGGFNDSSLNQAAGYDLSRQWQAGQTPDQYLKLGDISEAVRAELFSLNGIATITQLDLQQVALSAFPLVKEQTLEHLVDIVPGLGEQILGNVPPIATLVGNVDTILLQQPISQLLQQVPGVGQLQLDQINLDQFSLNSIPNLESVALQEFTDWENSFLKDIPGLGQVPLGQFPTPLAITGNFVARIDMAYSQAESLRQNTISGSYNQGLSVPCQDNCAYIELDDLENQGHSYRGSFEGKQWISGKYQKVSGGSGVCGELNGGKEPTGRHPFGKAFKVVVWDVDETTDTVDTALFFRVSCGWLGKTPYMIGPIPWFSYKVNAPIFLGLVENSVLNPGTQATVTQISPETLANTLQETENAAQLKNVSIAVTAAQAGVPIFLDKTGQPSNSVTGGCRGSFIKGCPVLSGDSLGAVSAAQAGSISVDALASAIAASESNGDYQAIGSYACVQGGTNCGRSLGKYQYMSYNSYVQPLIAAKPGGQEFLEKLNSGQDITFDELFEFFPPEDQDRLFQDDIANKIQQTSQEIDPTTGEPFTGERLLERVAQKHFGGEASKVNGTATDVLGESIYNYGRKVLEHYLQHAG